jgi:enoyl-CoA hydratase/carnithine racemase
MTHKFRNITVEKRGPVDWLTFNRPEALNALTPDMADEIADYFASLIEDSSVRVVVMRGAGRAFCAGLDVKAYLSADKTSGGLNRLPEIVRDMRACPQPVIALVHGAACGGGFAFALAADIRIAGESMKMNDAFVKLGVTGCELGVTYNLPRIVGASVARELMYTGNFIFAERAERVGLVSAVYADEELETAGEGLVSDMLRIAPLALRKTKETFNKLCDVDDFNLVVQREGEVQAECIDGPDFEEGLRAFAEKREPKFGTSYDTYATLLQKEQLTNATINEHNH